MNDSDVDFAKRRSFCEAKNAYSSSSWEKLLLLTIHRWISLVPQLDNIISYRYFRPLEDPFEKVRAKDSSSLYHRETCHNEQVTDAWPLLWSFSRFEEWISLKQVKRRWLHVKGRSRPSGLTNVRDATSRGSEHRSSFLRRHLDPQSGMMNDWDRIGIAPPSFPITAGRGSKINSAVWLFETEDKGSDETQEKKQTQWRSSGYSSLCNNQPIPRKITLVTKSKSQGQLTSSKNISAENQYTYNSKCTPEYCSNSINFNSLQMHS